MTAKMRSEAGKEAYKKRKETVEWPFGNIKQNLKMMWGKLAGKVDVLSKIDDFVANFVSAVTTSIFRFSFLLSRGVT